MLEQLYQCGTELAIFFNCRNNPIHEKANNNATKPKWQGIENFSNTYPIFKHVREIIFENMQCRWTAPFTCLEKSIERQSNQTNAGYKWGCYKQKTQGKTQHVPKIFPYVDYVAGCVSNIINSIKFPNNIYYFRLDKFAPKWVFFNKRPKHCYSEYNERYRIDIHNIYEYPYWQYQAERCNSKPSNNTNEITKSFRHLLSFAFFCNLRNLNLHNFGAQQLINARAES